MLHCNIERKPYLARIRRLEIDNVQAACRGLGLFRFRAVRAGAVRAGRRARARKPPRSAGACGADVRGRAALADGVARLEASPYPTQTRSLRDQVFVSFSRQREKKPA